MTASETPTATETPPTTETPTATEMPTTSVDYRYAALSEAAQSVIDELRDHPITRGIDELPALFEETRRFTISVDDTVYEVDVESNGYTADYARFTEAVGDVPADETIVDYTSLSEPKRALFREARSRTEYDERPPELPSYVRRDGVVYHVVLVVADIPERRITMRRV